MDLVPSRFSLSVESTFVRAKGILRRKRLVTVVTWNTNSFQMIGLNVIYYWSPKSLLSTHFANAWWFLFGCSICTLAMRDHLFAFLHHWLDLLIKGFEICIWLIWNCYCGRSSAWNILVPFKILAGGCLFLWQVSVPLNWFPLSSFFLLLDQITWCLVGQ